MHTLVFSKCLLSYCASNTDLIDTLLYPVCVSKFWRLGVDQGDDIILSDWAEVMKSHESIAQWFMLARKVRADLLEPIAVGEQEIPQIYIEVAKGILFSPRFLCVGDKQIFSALEVGDVQILDPHYARWVISTDKGIFKEWNWRVMNDKNEKSPSISISGSTISNSNLNLGSTLENVTQGVQKMGDDRASELMPLIEQLKAIILQAAQDHSQDKSVLESLEAVGDATNEIVEKSSKESPNPRSIGISAEGLLEAAKSVASAVPLLLPAAQAIVEKLVAWFPR